MNQFKKILIVLAPILGLIYVLMAGMNVPEIYLLIAKSVLLIMAVFGGVEVIQAYAKIGIKIDDLIKEQKTTQLMLMGPEKRAKTGAFPLTEEREKNWTERNQK